MHIMLCYEHIIQLLFEIYMYIGFFLGMRNTYLYYYNYLILLKPNNDIIQLIVYSIFKNSLNAIAYMLHCLILYPHVF